jgi:hypothetical protein
MPDRPRAAGARGPVAASPRPVPTGYRATPRRKFELLGALNFVGATALQGVIDVAVDEFLNRMQGTPGYTDALTAAETEQQRRAGVRTVKPRS